MRAKTPAIQDVSYDLPKAKMAWMSTYESIMTRQGDIRELSTRRFGKGAS